MEKANDQSCILLLQTWAEVAFYVLRFERLVPVADFVQVDGDLGEVFGAFRTLDPLFTNLNTLIRFMADLIVGWACIL